MHLTAARLALFEELINDLSKDGYRISLLLGARGYPAHDDTQFAAAILAAGNGKIDVVLASSEFEWLQNIRDADLLVSGRFHHSIAAACMQTPFIVLPSNTPKIEGLMQTLAEQSANAENFEPTIADQPIDLASTDGPTPRQQFDSKVTCRFCHFEPTPFQDSDYLVAFSVYLRTIADITVFVKL